MNVESEEVADLFDRAWSPLIGLLVSIGGSRPDAEEVAQDAFEKLLAAWPKVRRYEDPEAWLRTVAVRALISRHRRARVARSALPRLLVAPRTAGHADASHDRVDVAQAMSLLPVEQRAVVLLHYVYDLSVDTIAEDLRVPAGTVKSRLARARASLARSLQPEEAPRHA